MNDSTTNTIGLALWIAMFATPLITIPIIWNTLAINKVFRVLIGLVLAVLLSAVLYFIGLSLLMRNAFGATVTSNSLTINATADSIVGVEMDLSHFGIEADDFPSICAKINFLMDTGYYYTSFYNPTFKGESYSLSKKELVAVNTYNKLKTRKNKYKL